MSKLICGVGINDLPRGSISSDRRAYHFYDAWRQTLNRCYVSDNKNYTDVAVCDAWLVLSNFKEWYDQQYYVEGWHLDKDILVPKNRIYSPETCRFVPKEVNSLLTGYNKSKRSEAIGVDFLKSKYRARVTTYKESGKHLGYFDNELEAHNAYRVAKSDHIKDVVTQLAIDHPKLDPLISEALLVRAEKLLDFNLKYEDFM